MSDSEAWLTTFIDRVREMRDAQHRYYNKKNSGDLRQAMQLESIVDKMLADRVATQQRETGDLFGER